jgi:hypothetical protein
MPVVPPGWREAQGDHPVGAAGGAKDHQPFRATSRHCDRKPTKGGMICPFASGLIAEFQPKPRSPQRPPAPLA